MNKIDYLKDEVKHIDITSFDASTIIESMKAMGFSSRELGRASEIFLKMLADDKCTTVLSLAGSTSAAGCMQVYADMIKYNMIDVVVATGASIVDMDFFEGLGFKHYIGDKTADDQDLRKNYIDRIYDTYIDEADLQECDNAIFSIAENLGSGVYSSREFIYAMGKYLKEHGKKEDSLVRLAYEHKVPVFCPAFSDSSAGFGLVKHQKKSPDNHVSIDSVRDFRELTDLKINAGDTGLLIIGGGTPKNFIQDTVVSAEVLGNDVPMHKYAIQLTVADVRDGACSSSTLKEAMSWGKVDSAYEQMVYSEATLTIPLMISYAYHSEIWKDRSRRQLYKLFE